MICSLIFLYPFIGLTFSSRPGPVCFRVFQNIILLGMVDEREREKEDYELQDCLGFVGSYLKNKLGDGGASL